MCSIPYSRAASLAGKNCIPLVITFTCDELREKRISVGSSPIRRVGEGVDFVGKQRSPILAAPWQIFPDQHREEASG